MTALSLEERLQDRMDRLLEERRHSLAIYIERMKGLSPLEKLNSGYSYVTDAQGRNIRSVTQAIRGQAVQIQVKDGKIGAMVQDIWT